MSDLIRYFRRDERGATATEYALLVVFVLVAVAIAAGASTLGQGISSLFSQIGTLLSGITPVLPPLP
jgi:Flp pilus assembly pilin Flp